MSIRRENFKRLSAERMSRILMRLELISNLSSHNYMYKDEWIKQIIELINEQGFLVKDQFLGGDTISKDVSFIIKNEYDFEELNGKEKKFIELAESRMNSLLSDIYFFSKLSNKNNYTYEIEDIEYLFNIFELKVIEVEQWFLPYKKDMISNNIDVLLYPSEKKKSTS